jgi:NAD(P)H-nitrite reductase large subunit
MAVPHYLIVGAGPAGFSAADAIRRLRPDATITIVADDPHGYYSRPGLAYVLTRELPEARLFPISKRGWAKMRVRRVVAQAVEIDTSARRVLLADGRALTYDALLIATGSASIAPPFAGVELDGVVTLDHLADLHCILRLARRARSAVVVGGGILALELVEGLRAQNVSVHYFLRRERFWGAVLDATESHLVEERLARDGVHIHRHTEIARVLAGKDWRGRERVAGVETRDGRSLACQMVGAAIGVRPRLELVANTPIYTGRGILVNERMETSVPSIYAAGDVAQLVDPLTGQGQPMEALWPVAIAQGRVAGSNMAGEPVAYRRAVPVNVVRLTGLPVTIVGAAGAGEDDDDLLTISRGDSELWRGVPGLLMIYARQDVNRQRLVFDRRNRLVGAVLVGDQSLTATVLRLIEKQVDFGPYLTQVQSPQANLAEILRSVAGREDEDRARTQP